MNNPGNTKNPKVNNNQITTNNTPLEDENINVNKPSQSDKNKVQSELEKSLDPITVFRNLLNIDKDLKQNLKSNPLEIANKYLGLDESNPEHQKTIKGFFDEIIPNFVSSPEKVTEDAYAWCAAFVNNVLTESKIDVPLKNKEDKYEQVRAKAYSEVGTSVGNINNGKPGDIMVVKNNKGGYHVGFYAGMKNNKHLILGGNQNNKVSVKELNLDSFEIISINRLDSINDIKSNQLKLIQDTPYFEADTTNLNIQ